MIILMTQQQAMLRCGVTCVMSSSSSGPTNRPPILPTQRGQNSRDSGLRLRSRRMRPCTRQLIYAASSMMEEVPSHSHSRSPRYPRCRRSWITGSIAAHDTVFAQWRLLLNTMISLRFCSCAKSSLCATFFRPLLWISSESELAHQATTQLEAAIKQAQQQCDQHVVLRDQLTVALGVAINLNPGDQLSFVPIVVKRLDKLKDAFKTLPYTLQMPRQRTVHFEPELGEITSVMLVKNSDKYDVRLGRTLLDYKQGFD